jgi:hypothetical protein
LQKQAPHVIQVLDSQRPLLGHVHY